MKPQLSIIIPIYNAAPWLCKCLDSLRAQSFLDWEALLVDDGSTDASSDICKEYVARDDRFHFWTKIHEGVVSARQSGVQRASAPMVGFVDADDWIEPNMYEEMMSAARNAEAVICGYFRHSAEEIQLPSIFPGDGVYKDSQYESLFLNQVLCAKDRSCFDRAPTLWNTLLPTQLVRKTLNQMDKRIQRGEDSLSVYSCLLQVKSLACLEIPLYHYRIHGNSIMARIGFGNYSDTALFYQQLVESIKNLRPDLLPQASSFFLYLISLGINENPQLIKYPEVRKLLWKESLLTCCNEWRKRIILMRLKSLFSSRLDF